MTVEADREGRGKIRIREWGGGGGGGERGETLQHTIDFTYSEQLACRFALYWVIFSIPQYSPVFFSNPDTVVNYPIRIYHFHYTCVTHRNSSIIPACDPKSDPYWGWFGSGTECLSWTAIACRHISQLFTSVARALRYDIEVTLCPLQLLLP